MNIQHFDDISPGFLLCDKSPVNGVSNREADVRMVVLREELTSRLTSRPLMKAVDMFGKLVSIDLPCAPPLELGLKFRKLGG